MTKTNINNHIVYNEIYMLLALFRKLLLFNHVYFSQNLALLESEKILQNIRTLACAPVTPKDSFHGQIKKNLGSAGNTEVWN